MWPVRKVSVPPWGMASRAFTARFSRTWSSCVGSAQTTGPGSANSLLELDGAAEQTPEQVGHGAHRIIDRHRLRLQVLLPAECEKLTHQGRAAPGAAADLLQILNYLCIRRLWIWRAAYQGFIRRADDRCE